MRYMKAWLIGIFASLLTASLCGLILTTVLGQTIMNSHYLEDQFAAVDGYNRLSAALSNDVVQQTGLSNIPQATAIVQGIVTPAIVKQRVNGALDNMESYLQGKGAPPTINFSDLGTQAQSLGLPLRQDSDLFQPITLGPTSTSKGHVNLNITNTRVATLFSSALLALLVLALSLKWERYTALPGVLISVGIVMGAIALIAYFALGNMSHYITLSSGSDSFVTIARDLVQNIGKDLGRRFGIIAAICLVGGIATRILAARLQKEVAKARLLSSSQVSLQQ
jgi:hypothetical protein